VHEVAAQRTDAEFELVDLLDYKLPHLDESYPASMGQYTQPHTLSWSNKIASLTAT
jgi:NAD(P)H-dependent FMN reductase